MTPSRSSRDGLRKRIAAILPASLALLALAGCATPGPNHTYVASAGDAPILDLAKGRPTAEIPSHLFPFNTLYGVAYDPFTDHLFLRTVAGNFVRVIDRPARSVKYDFTAEGLPRGGGGDLAIRSRDRHLFFIHPTEPVLVETNLRGKHVRDITLQDLPAPPAGVAYDQKRDRFLILIGGRPDRVATYSLDGRRLGSVNLDHRVHPTSLAFDSAARELYAPLRDQSAIGVFDLEGRLLRELPLPPAQDRDHIDVGPRSLIRLF